ncbi:MAG: S8 family serine peptidase, partial [Chthoniobacterales bacterium]
MKRRISFLLPRPATLALLLLLTGLSAVTAQITQTGASFFAGGKRYPLTEATGWVAVRIAPGARPADVQASMRNAVAADPAREAIYHSQYRILVQPVQDAASQGRVAQLQQAMAAVPGVEKPVRMFHNGKLSPIIETEEFLIQFKRKVSRAEIDQLLAQHGAEIARPLGSYARNGYVARITNPERSSSIETANSLHGKPGVIYSHPNLIWPKEQKFVPNDALYPQQWHLNNTGSNGPTGGLAGGDIKAERAWEITRGSSNVVVAIVDDGVATSHEDFNSTNKIKAGWDFVDNDNTPVPGLPGDNHGTSCAGLAVANGNNSLGGSGVAPGCRLMSVRLLGANATPENEAAAISSARDNGATVISNSWGPADRGGPNNTSIAQPCPDNVSAAITDVATNGRGGKGCVVLWAAGNGNESVDLDGYASHPHVICVAASNNRDQKASYSDFGNAIDIAAPGSEADMVTTDRMGSAGYNAGNYTFNFNGTSAATPVAAGAAALILSKEPNLTRTQVKQRLIDTADFIDTANATYDSNGHHPWYGYGRVNVWKALAKPDTTAPTISIRAPSNGVSATSITAADGTTADTGVGVYQVLVALSDSQDRWWNWTSNGWSGPGSYIGSTDYHLKVATLTDASWNTTLPNLGSGSYRFHAKVLDKADNESAFAFADFVVDSTGPQITIAQPQDSQNYGSAPQASGTALDNIADKRFALFREADGLWYNWSSNTFDSANFVYANHVKFITNSATDWTLDLPSLGAGKYELHALTTDTTNRASDWIRRDFRVNLPPEVRVLNPANGAGVQEMSGILGEAVDTSGKGLVGNQVNFTLYCDGSYWTGTQWTTTQTVLHAPVNGGWWGYADVPTGSNERTGEYFISANVQDLAGGTSALLPGINQTSFRIDRNPPDVAITSPANGSTIVARNFQFKGTVSDPGGVEWVNVFLRRGSDSSYWNGSSWGSAPVVLSTEPVPGTDQWVNVSGLPRLGSDPNTEMANGSYNFIAIAMDKAGNYKQIDSVVTLDFHETFTWTRGSHTDAISGNDSEYWQNPANWTPYGVPGSQDVAIVELNHGLRSSTPLNIEKLKMSTGSIQFDNAAHALTITKGGEWKGGSINAHVNIQSGATFAISGAEVKWIGNGYVVNNSGVVTWAGPGTVRGYQNSVWNNKAGSSFIMTTDGDVFSNNYGGNVFNNEATAQFIKTLGTIENGSYIDEWTFNNAGKIDSRQGTVHFNTTLNLNSGSNLAGAGRVLFNGTTNLTTLLSSTGNPHLVGTLNGNHASAGFTGTNPFNWSYGTINGAFTLAAGSVLDLTTTDVKWLGNGAIFTNKGRVNWKDGGALRGYQNSAFNNESGAVFAMFTDGDVFSNNYGGNVFNNKAGAVFVKSGKSTTAGDYSYVDEWTFNNAGAIRSDDGLLRFHTALNLNPGGAIRRSGALPARVLSTYYFVLTGTTTVDNITFEAGGDWHGNLAEGTAGNGTIATSAGGVFEWTAGTAHNVVNITAGSTFSISGEALKWIGGSGVVKNNGNATWTGTGGIRGYQNSTFANLAGASFTAITDADFTNNYGGNRFQNAANANFKKTGGAE